MLPYGLTWCKFRGFFWPYNLLVGPNDVGRGHVPNQIFNFPPLQSYGKIFKWGRKKRSYDGNYCFRFD